MTALVLDAGALIALDRNERAMWARLRAAAEARDIVAVPTGVVAQAGRGGRGQALLAQALMHCEELVLDSAMARACGRLCARSGTNDVIDAWVAIAASRLSLHHRTVVATSHPDDIRGLTATLGDPVVVATV